LRVEHLGQDTLQRGGQLPLHFGGVGAGGDRGLPLEVAALLRRGGRVLTLGGTRRQVLVELPLPLTLLALTLLSRPLSATTALLLLEQLGIGVDHAVPGGGDRGVVQPVL